MKTRQLIIAAAMLAVTGGTAMAQQTSTMEASSPGVTVPASAANGVSNDPYVQKRQSDADAKAEYKTQKKAVKQQAKTDKKAAKADLKAEKKESTAERNAQLAQPQPKTDKTQ